MKKIPTLFNRVYDNHKIVDILPDYPEEFKWVFDGEGEATVKIDGSCCAIINSTFYKRYDAKKGKPVPKGAIKCQEEADPITGHLPCWIRCDRSNPADKWFWAAYDYSAGYIDGTYEAIGKHFQGNPYGIDEDRLVKHGSEVIIVERTFEGIKTIFPSITSKELYFGKMANQSVK